MKTKQTGRLLETLRGLMKDSKHLSEPVHAYIVPSEDAHQSEYIADCDERRAFITGFDGSRGLAAVTSTKAGMWTDGRYFLQASKQMDQNWTLMKEKVGDTPSLTQWLIDEVPSGGRVGVDPFLMALDAYESLGNELKKRGIALVPVAENLVDVVWGAERPTFPSAPIIVLPVSYTGESWQDKIRRIRTEMKSKSASLLVLSALDEVAWTFNLRGSDIPYNPVFFSYAIIGLNSVALFVHEDKVTSELRHHFQSEEANGSVQNGEGSMDVQLLPYSAVLDYLDKFVKENAGFERQRVWVPGESTSFAVGNLVPKEKQCQEQSPVAVMKAQKNAVELEGLRQAHLRDAVAHCEFLCWIESEIKKGVTELSAADKFEELRKEQRDFVSLSFPTISSTGPDAAVIHYCVTKETDKPLVEEDLYLVDSGAQYKDGTTDVTRTISFTQPTAYQRECFTRVFKGHVRLAMQKFPQGVPGIQLDALSRVDLWEAGLDYRHGTGHGVGHYLFVHEGPASIGYRSANTWKEGVKEKMVLTIEPGYYEDGQFGIRIENVYAVVSADTPYKYQDTHPLTFESLTLVPIQTKMLDPHLLTKKELDWLNSYHELCRDKVGALLLEQGKNKAHAWLLENTQPLG